MKSLLSACTMVLVICFSSLSAIAQISTTEDFNKRLEELKLSVPPYYRDFLMENFTSVEMQSPRSETIEYDFQLVLKHKTMPLEFRMNVRPNATVIPEPRLKRIAREIGIDENKEVQTLKPSQYEFIGCDQGNRVFGRQTKSYTAYEAAAAFLYLKNDGFVEYTLFYDYPKEADKKEFNTTLSRVLNSFRFAADVKTGDSFAGVGINFMYDAQLNGYKVMGVVKDGPAYKSGILPGDQIYAIAGTKINKKDLSRVVNEIRGVEGSLVKIEVLRGVLFYNYEVERTKIDLNEELVFVESKDYELQKLYFNNTVDFLLSGKLSDDYKQDYITETALGKQYKFKMSLPGGYPGRVTVNEDDAENLIEYTLISPDGITSAEQFDLYKSYLLEKYKDDFLFEPRENENEFIIETITPEFLTEHAILSLEDQNGQQQVVLRIYRPFNLDKKD